MLVCCMSGVNSHSKIRVYSTFIINANTCLLTWKSSQICTHDLHQWNEQYDVHNNWYKVVYCNIVQTIRRYIGWWCVRCDTLRVAVHAQLCSGLWLRKPRHWSSGLWTHMVKFLKLWDSQIIMPSSYVSFQVCSMSLQCIGHKMYQWHDSTDFVL